MAETIPGGYGPTLKVTEEIQKLGDQVKSQVEKKTGMNYEEFRAVVYRRQIVKGTNFLIKVHVGGTSYIHLLVFEALPCNGGHLTLRDVLANQTKDSPLEPFK